MYETYEKNMTERKSKRKSLILGSNFLQED